MIDTNREVFLHALSANDWDFKIIGGAPRHSAYLNLRFAGIDAEILTTNLQPTLAISTGAACASGMPEPSHVLRAIGLTAQEASECVRIGFGRFTNEEQARQAAHLLTEAVLDHAHTASHET